MKKAVIGPNTDLHDCGLTDKVVIGPYTLSLAIEADSSGSHEWQRHRIRTDGTVRGIATTEQSKGQNTWSRKTAGDLMAEEEADGKFKRSHGRNKKGSVGREMARAGGVEAKED